MRYVLLPLACLTLLITAAPLTAQIGSASTSGTIQQRADALNVRIDAAVRSGALTRSQATTLRTEVGRVQTSAGNEQARGGRIPASAADDFERELARLEQAVPAGMDRGSASQRAANVRATADMRSRLSAAVDRVRVGEQHHQVTPARSVALRRQLGDAQDEMARLSRRQGFVSAAQLATYARMVEATDAELSAAAGRHSYGNDALPSAEVTAFQRMDGRLRYRNARIEYDAGSCAVYQGVAPNGRTRRVPLRDAASHPICRPR